jgi:hypothetical protein
MRAMAASSPAILWALGADLDFSPVAQRFPDRKVGGLLHR